MGNWFDLSPASEHVRNIMLIILFLVLVVGGIAVCIIRIRWAERPRPWNNYDRTKKGRR